MTDAIQIVKTMNNSKNPNAVDSAEILMNSSPSSIEAYILSMKNIIVAAHDTSARFLNSSSSFSKFLYHRIVEKTAVIPKIITCIPSHLVIDLFRLLAREKHCGFQFCFPAYF